MAHPGARPRIRPMQAFDIEPATVAIRDGGWGERRTALDFHTQDPNCHLFVAESDPDGTIVGTSMATQNGAVGWVGLVFVAPSWRGRGLGGELTQTALQCLGELGCRSMVLAATDLGRPVYERLGFEPDGDYVIFTGPPATDPQASPAPSDPRVRRLQPRDLSAVLELDRHATGEDRAHLIRASADGWVVIRDGRVSAYALRGPLGLGPVIAADAADGPVLVDILRREAAGERMQLTTTSANLSAIDYLGSIGFEEQRRLPRMVYGERVAWQPASIWSIFSFAVG